ncbi:MAG: hypothetical protein JO112_16435 [Planctomycetes bacterium]|nr:hypothetical protein [Planctomycetota bacterium]
MNWFRPSLLWFLTLPLVLPAPAPAQPPPPKTAPPPKVQPPQNNADAAKVFDDALHKLEQIQTGWVAADVRQQGTLQGLSFQAEGKYLSGPDHRMHLDLQVRLADMSGRLVDICDGATMWETMQFGSGEPVVTRKVDMKRVLATLDAPGINSQVRTEYFLEEPFTGLVPLFQSIRRQMVFTRREEHVAWKGHDTTRLTAVWSPPATKDLPPNDPEQFVPWPRGCRLYLDSVTLWPYRLEWWGPEAGHPADTVLLQMDFLNPTIYPKQDAAPSQFANAFTFHPGPGEVPDKTEDTIAHIKARSKELAGQKSGSTP